SFMGDAPRGSASPILGDGVSETEKKAGPFLLVCLAMTDLLRPYVAIATLCERVLQEKDGVVTIVRAIDTYNLHQDPAETPTGVTPVLQVTGFISLKSGPVTGEHDIELVFENPLGERKSLSTHKVLFEGYEHGINAEIGLP